MESEEVVRFWELHADLQGVLESLDELGWHLTFDSYDGEALLQGPWNEAIRRHDTYPVWD